MDDRLTKTGETDEKEYEEQSDVTYADQLARGPDLGLFPDTDQSRIRRNLKI